MPDGASLVSTRAAFFRGLLLPAVVRQTRFRNKAHTGDGRGIPPFAKCAKDGAPVVLLYGSAVQG